MESKRHHHQPPIESTPTTSLEELQSLSTQELQDSAPETPKPRGFEGRRHTPETKAKLSEAMKGEKNPNYGKKLSPEHRAKLSEANKGDKNSSYGKKHTPEARAKMSEANKGKKHTPETKAKLSAAHKGKKLSPETRAKMSEAQKGRKNPSYGKKVSPETRAKISEAQKGEKSYIYDQNIDKVRLAIIDCVLGESQIQASRNQGFEHNWLAKWKRNHRQRFDAFYLEIATELDRMVTNGKIGHLALELANGPTRQDLAHKLDKHLSVSSESPPQPDPKD